MNDRCNRMIVRRPHAVDRQDRLFGIHHSILVALPIIAILLSTFAATAQTWQNVYGANATVQEGRRGARAVVGNCQGGQPGFISVGYTVNVAGGIAHLYVVRTDNNGATLWENSYNLVPFQIGDWDTYGESIIELSDGSGFVIAGTVVGPSPSYSDAFLVKIDCNGGVTWVGRYGAGNYDYGYDVIEKITGTPGYVLAGRTDDPSGNNADALLIQANPATGALIWGKTYDQFDPHDDEGFWSLTQATPVGSDPGGDIIAVGHTGHYGPGPKDAYVVRVRENDGEIATPLQGAAQYGSGLEDDRFYSAIELQNPSETGTNGQPNVVIAGYAHHPVVTTDRDMYLVKLDGGDPCTPLIQNIVGMPGPGMNDEARHIREITFAPGAGAPHNQWDIAVGGSLEDPTPQKKRMALSVLNGATLTPIGGQLYGNLVYGDEEAYSVYPIDPGTSAMGEGFLLCGPTTTPWHAPNYSDPGDLMLVRTNNQYLSFGCEVGYGPGHEAVQWEVPCFTPEYDAFTPNALNDASPVASDNDDPICTDGSNDGDPFNKEVLTPSPIEWQLAAQPNPLRNDQPLMLALDGFNSDHGITLSVTNSLGEVVASEFDRFNPSTGEISMKTTGWPAGAYSITVRNGERAWSTKVIVLE